MLRDNVHEMLRDVFFIDDPIVNEVPRRNERQCYYARGLVATAVKFNSNMSPEEIRKVDIERFSNLPEMSDFEFVKAADESLASPSVDLWDFLTLKHVIGQSPIYIRRVSKNNDNIDNCSSKYDDDDLKDYVLTTKKENAKPLSTSRKPNSKDLSNQPSCSKAVTFNITSEGQKSFPHNEPCSSKNIQFFKPKQAKVQCPLCNDMFTRKNIEFHVATRGRFEQYLISKEKNKCHRAFKRC